MSIKDQFSADQWKALLNAPSAAAAYVATASGGGFEIIKEVFTAAKLVQEAALQSGGSGYGKLVDDLLAAMKEMKRDEAKESVIQYQSKDPQGLRTEAKQVVAGGAAAAATQAEADGYKRWLLFIARKVAETRTGGFLGFGASSEVDAQEQAALNELQALLGV